MLTRLREAGLIWPTLWMLPALAVLIGLGTWQLQRKVWKDGLIASIKQRVTAEPIPVEEALRRFQANPDIEYLRVTTRGGFRHQDERLLYAPDQRFGPGYHVISPLVLTGQLHGPRSGCGDYVLVNRGYVPEALKSPDKRQHNADARGDLVVGLVRLPERPGRFTPANEPSNNLWFWRDLAGLAASLSLPRSPACAGNDGPRPLPFFIDAEPEEPKVNPGGFPKGGATILDIPNRHLDYAATWYGLAVTLVGVYLAFAIGRIRACPS